MSIALVRQVKTFLHTCQHDVPFFQFRYTCSEDLRRHIYNRFHHWRHCWPTSCLVVYNRRRSDGILPSRFLVRPRTGTSYILPSASDLRWCKSRCFPCNRSWTVPRTARRPRRARQRTHIRECSATCRICELDLGMLSGKDKTGRSDRLCTPLQRWTIANWN